MIFKPITFTHMYKPTHRGEIVFSVVKKMGITIDTLAKKMKTQRSTLYSQFDNANLNYRVIQRIGYAIAHDFRKEFPNMTKKEGEHRGKIVEAIVKKSGITIESLSRKLRTSRNALYYRFSNPNLKFKAIDRIGDAIKYDFRREFPEMDIHLVYGAKPVQDEADEAIKEIPGNTEVWKDKYLRLMDKYIALLEETRPK